MQEAAPGHQPENEFGRHEAAPISTLSVPVEDGALTQEELALLWFAGHYLQAPQLMTDSMTALITTIDRQGKVDDQLDLEYIWENTQSEFPLRKVFIDALVFHGGLDAICDKNSSKEWPTELLLDVIRRQRGATGSDSRLYGWSMLKPHNFHQTEFETAT